MGKVMTVLGERDASMIGFTDMHTHITVRSDLEKPAEETSNNEIALPADVAGVEGNLDLSKMTKENLEIKMENLYDLRRGYWTYAAAFEAKDIEIVQDEVQKFAVSGGKTIVEASVKGSRSDLHKIRQISEATGVNIVLSTGFYGEGYWPEKYTTWSDADLVTFLTDEVENGMDGTEYKPGIVKMACNFFSDIEKKGLRVGAVTAKENGLSLSVHTGGGKLNPDYTYEMSKIIKQQGMNLERVVFLHMDQFVTNPDLLEYMRNHDEASKLQLDPIRRLLDTGATVSFDCFGAHEHKEINYYVQASDYDRMAALYTFIQEGYQKQLVIGTDLGPSMYFKKYGGAGYTRLTEFVAPALRDLGVSDDAIADITINNPARILSKQ